MLFRQISINLTFKHIGVSWKNIMAGMPTEVNNISCSDPVLSHAARRPIRMSGWEAAGPRALLTNSTGYAEQCKCSRVGRYISILLFQRQQPRWIISHHLPFQIISNSEGTLFISLVASNLLSWRSLYLYVCEILTIITHLSYLRCAMRILISRILGRILSHFCNNLLNVHVKRPIGCELWFSWLSYISDLSNSRTACIHMQMLTECWEIVLISLFSRSHQYSSPGRYCIGQQGEQT